MQQAAFPKPPDRRLEQILSPNHPLCKEDVVWVLEFVKKKVAEQDPRLLDLPQPRLLRNFQHFAEAATMLLQRRPSCVNEADRLRTALVEATYGLLDPAPPRRER
ncbi:hypothetical protein FE783_27225 [Paenibacillus mesophilus]|uniref:hypothetical protein n=1 Tax=Paenibacillus mesophilus TaxID=2582849 RepID=UPI00110DBF36|nr:hypothetical protein [Paenibacillus mesophilus]TMV46116.1 hypothetical protein FE783_27225 [Paenibacillus mesophilus]